MIMRGIVGIIKYYLIRAIKNSLETKSLPKKIPLPLLAPTRVVAFSISAATIHFSVQLPIKDITPLRILEDEI